MKWRTAIESSNFTFQISLDTSVLLLGSCFAEHIGVKLKYHKFLATTNPTGISYNPISLAENVRRAANLDLVSETELHHNGEKYVHFDFHGQLGHYDSPTCQHIINDKLKQLHQLIIHAEVICISLGSAIVFELIENKHIVSNCHKFPQGKFNKRQLSISEISSSLNALIDSIYQINNKVNILMTVSPVRHTRHGLIDNNRSKANLIAATHDLIDHHEMVYYFPSYEIVMDDLRDYRFFKRDLVHPSEEAIDYIWTYLINQCMTEKTQVELKSIKSVVDSYHHIPMSTSPDVKTQFLRSVQNKMSNHQYTERFSQEISDIDHRIKKMTSV